MAENKLMLFLLLISSFPVIVGSRPSAAVANPLEDEDRKLQIKLNLPTLRLQAIFKVLDGTHEYTSSLFIF